MQYNGISKAKFVKKTFLISKWLGLGLGFEIKKVFEQIYSIGLEEIRTLKVTCLNEFLIPIYML